MTDKNQVEQLVEEGIAAAKSGDRALARGKLEAAVQIDQYNEKAWFWLARVVDTDEERRACLGNVIIINPQNQKAQQLLDKLENRAAAKETKGRFSPRLLLAGAGGLIILCLVGTLLSGVLSGDDDAEVLPTQFALGANTDTPDATQVNLTQAVITPSATPFVRATIPPTWTATPGPTSTPTVEDFPSPPTGLPGRIILQSGRVTGDEANQPIVMVNGDDLSTVRLSNEGDRGQNPVLAPGSNRFAYSQYLPGSRSFAIQIQNAGFPDKTNITSLYPESILLATPNYPAWTGNNLVFSAPEFGSGAHDLWLLELDEISGATPVPSFGTEQTSTPTPTLTPSATLTPEGFQPSPTPAGPTATPTMPPSALTRLTDDPADNLWPAFDPTGTALVYVQVLNGVTDLMVVNVNTKAQFVLTQNGNLFIESAPDWGPNNEIIFSASTQGNTEESDIYLMQADNLEAEPVVLIDFGPQDIKPRFSPDGRYIVFSSNVRGNWDVFIYDRETEEFYGLVTDPNSTDIANDWAE